MIICLCGINNVENVLIAENAGNSYLFQTGGFV